MTLGGGPERLYLDNRVGVMSTWVAGNGVSALVIDGKVVVTEVAVMGGVNTWVSVTQPGGLNSWVAEMGGRVSIKVVVTDVSV